MMNHFHRIHHTSTFPWFEWLDLGPSVHPADLDPSHVGAGKEAIHIHRSFATKPVAWRPLEAPGGPGDRAVTDSPQSLQNVTICHDMSRYVIFGEVVWDLR